MENKYIEVPPIHYDNHDNNTEPLVLRFGSTIYAVHSIGKVASKSIFACLKNCITSPIYHLHYLNEDTLDRMYTWFVSNTTYTTNHAEIIDGEIFAKTLLKYTDDFHWKIITLIREPIAWQISMLFEIAQIAFPKVLQNNVFDQEAFKIIANDSFRSSIDSPILNISFYQKWWDTEFTSIFGIDVLKQPFNPDKGWEIYKNGKIEVLVIQYEQLNNVFNEATTEFELPQNIILPEINKTSNKLFGKCNHFEVINEFKLSDSIVNDLYKNRIVKHFYNQEQIDNFTHKWVSQK